MADFLSIVTIAGGVGLILFGVIYGIPKWVILSTESENDPNHIYTIFMEESGYRGHKALSATGALFPFILLSKQSNNLEDFLWVSAISVILFIPHWSVYTGYPVFNRRMKVALPLILIVLAIFAILTRNGFMPVGFFIFILVSAGVAWGSYAVYQRSKLIRSSRQYDESGEKRCA